MAADRQNAIEEASKPIDLSEIANRGFEFPSALTEAEVKLMCAAVVLQLEVDARKRSLQAPNASPCSVGRSFDAT